MSRRDDQDQKQKRAPEQVQEVEQEQEAPEKESPETAYLHETLGNAALSNLLPNDPGAFGDDMGMAQLVGQSAAQDMVRDYGGDDDEVLVDPGQLILDHSQSWSPEEKPQERPEFDEPMPDDELPPEDWDWIDNLPDPTGALPATSAPHPLLQPSLDVLVRGRRHWIDAATRLQRADDTARVIGYLLRANHRSFIGGDARVLPVRARLAAVGVALIADGIPTGTRASDIALDRFAVELAARKSVVDHVRTHPGVPANEMPSIEGVLMSHLLETRGYVLPSTLPAGTANLLREVIEDLVDLPSAKRWLPNFAVEGPKEVDDDPLGLDAILREFTGHVPDPDDAMYGAAIDAAEHLARTCAQTRVHIAAVAVAVERVALLHASGSPSETVLHLGRSLDKEVANTLSLLLDVARAAQTRSVPPRGIQRGLTRVARSLDKIRTLAIQLLVELVAGIVPGLPEARESLAPVPEDAIEDAWNDGRPMDALPHLAPEAAALLTGDPDALQDLQRHPRPLVAETAGVLYRAAMLRMGAPEAVLASVDHFHGRIVGRRDGIALAQLTLDRLDAMHALGEETRSVRDRAGAKTLLFGNRAAMSVLARWFPHHAG